LEIILLFKIMVNVNSFNNPILDIWDLRDSLEQLVGHNKIKIHKLS